MPYIPQPTMFFFIAHVDTTLDILDIMISYIHMILKHLTFMTILHNFPLVTLMTFLLR